eukprot:m.1030762 g.1030762  ORF g.1030762 m.1030762 type:complete len:121 (+) comp24119_c0_seq33:1335-1697(+)
MMQTSAERISDGIDTVASVQPLLAVDNNMLSGVRIRFQLARGGRTKVLRAVLAMETWNLHNFHRLRDVMNTAGATSHATSAGHTLAGRAGIEHTHRTRRVHLALERDAVIRLHTWKLLIA